jgi:predicted  nucleic acid-binding Zn-ribbon protein
LSIPEQIRALEELASMDAQLKTLEEQLTTERGSLSTLKANLKRLDDKLKADRASLGAMDKTRNELIADVRTMMTQLEHSREKLNRSRTERETNAATRELEELRKLIRDREDEIGKLTTESDANRQQIEATEADAKKIQDELTAREDDINAKLALIEADKALRETARNTATKKLPAALFRRYDMVRQKRGVGIAQTTDGTCKACNMALPPQLFHRLRREPMLEQCPSCNRIIYYVPPQAGAGADEKSSNG